MKVSRLTSVLTAMLCALCAGAFITPTKLTVEHLTSPLNIEHEHPRLSWIIDTDLDDVRQTSYHIVVYTVEYGRGDLRHVVWDSGVVESDQSVLVPYDGDELKPSKQYHWYVRVGTNKGESRVSETATFGTGVMGEANWQGRWIGYDAPYGPDVEDEHSRLGARYLRQEFETKDKEVSRAIVHICGLGLYELFINGRRVGEQVLAPAPTDYRRTVLYNTHDITDLIRGEGACNAIGVALGNGRYYTMQQNKKKYKIPTFGYPSLRLNLIIEYTDNTTQRISTNEKWRLNPMGPIRSNNEYDGEIYDARLELGDWASPGYDDSQWMAAQRARLPYGTLRPNTSANMTIMRRIEPRSIRRTDRGYIVDFGQNTAGWVRLNHLRSLQAGDTIRVRYSELVSADSLRLDTENLRHAQSTDIYVANGNEDDKAWSPRFSYHGFRFVEVSGIDSLEAADLTAEVIYDEMDDNGHFSCSSQVINDIHRNAWWGVTSNYKGMPIDCPQRDERQPWTGDHNMGTWGENFMLDNAAFYIKWLRDILQAQREDGCIPDVCPAFWNYYSSEMTWSSTLPVVCDMIYQQTGDAAPIADSYEPVTRWLKHIRKHFTQPSGLIRADTYGDWCTPPERPELIHAQDSSLITDRTLISSAYYCKMTRMASEMARLLGLEADAAYWSGESQRMAEVFNREFLTVKPGSSAKRDGRHPLYPDSTYYGNNTLTSNILPLAFDIVPEQYADDIIDNVITTIITRNNGHLSCGVVGINWIMRELTRRGRGDVAMLLATSTTYPGWGYEITKGATTIWELWNGDTASRKMNSANHVMMLGDLVPWMYRDLAGINPGAPGYKVIVLKPDFSIPDLFDVDASYETPYGRVSSKWSRHSNAFVWDIEIPANTYALVHVPTTDPDDLKGVRAELVETDGDNTIWRMTSGRHHIAFDIDPSRGWQRQGIVTDEFIYESASFPECHASTIVELPNGDLVTAFFGGTKEKNPDCCIWVSRLPKGADRWTEPRIAADGVFAADDPYRHLAGLSGIDSTTTAATAGPVGPRFKGDIDKARRKACWNPVLYQIPGEKDLLLFYKIGSNVGDWTGWIVRSKDGGRTWSKREPLPEGILGPIKNKPEYINGRLICPSSRETGGWRLWIEYSDDKGRTWHATGPLPSDSGYISNDTKRWQPYAAIQPSILKLSDGRLKILCRSRNSRLVQSYSSDNGATWQRATLSDLPNNNSGTDAVTLADGRHILIYNDFATVAGTPKGPRTPLCIAISDDGETWRKIATLEDSPISQYSYPAIIQGRDGRIHAVYTWRRQRIKHVVIDLPK